MPWRKTRMLGAALLLFLLAGSLCLNAALVLKFRSKLIEVADVRSDPVGGRWFAGANRDLPPKTTKSRVIFFGDSRIASWENFPAIDNVEFINRGIGGQTTAQLVGRLEQDVLNLDPDIVVIQAGINDLKEIGLVPNRSESITNSCIANLAEIRERLRDGQISMVLMTTFANGPVELRRRPLWSPQINAAIDRVNQEIKTWEGDGVLVFPSGDVLEDDSKRVKPEYARDTLHLTSLGYEALNEHISPLISQLVTGPAN